MKKKPPDITRLRLILSDHAVERHAQRVGIACNEYELWWECALQIAERDYWRKKRLIQLGTVWWQYVVCDSDLVFTTCYGAADINLAAAMEWQDMHNDRINLAEVGGMS